MCVACDCARSIHGSTQEGRGGGGLTAMIKKVRWYSHHTSCHKYLTTAHGVGASSNAVSASGNAVSAGASGNAAARLG